MCIIKYPMNVRNKKYVVNCKCLPEKHIEYEAIDENSALKMKTQIENYGKIRYESTYNIFRINKLFLNKRRKSIKYKEKQKWNQ